MANFCVGLEQTAFTDSDLLSTYTTKNKKGLLGAGGPGILGSINVTASERDPETKLISQAALPGVLSNLQAKGIIPIPPSMTTNKNQNKVINAFMREETTAIDNIKLEYCHTLMRYKYALNTLIEKLQTGYASTDTANKAQVEQKLATTIELNRKLNDLVLIVNEYTKTRLGQSQSYNESINSLNQNLLLKSKALSAQNKTLNSGKADALLYKEMVKYTTEKTNYTTNMLMLYSFLNVTAIGLLFYAYRSFED